MQNIPTHIVLFPDGNRRWAKQQGLPTLEGHNKGYEKLVEFCQWLKDRGVKVLTAFGFSTENWNRSKEEIDYLMKLLEDGFRNSLKDERYEKARVKVRVIGQKERLPQSLQEAINKIEEDTKDNKEFYLNFAISYGGKWDILQAVQKIVAKKIPAEEINEELIGEYLSTAGLPAPDLIIRAGGEKRLSNFLLWQAAYAEIYFSDKLWPDFGEGDLDRALEDFAQRQRRFGK